MKDRFRQARIAWQQQLASTSRPSRALILAANELAIAAIYHYHQNSYDTAPLNWTYVEFDAVHPKLSSAFQQVLRSTTGVSTASWKHNRSALKRRATNWERELKGLAKTGLLGLGAAQDKWFRWPSTWATIGDGTIPEADWPRTGLLSVCGYRVGRSGGTEGGRRRILDRVFRDPIPGYFETEWGRPRTAQRLQKLAESIASFTRNAKRRTDCDMSIAVAEWQADLDYLHKKYYVGHFGFLWPSAKGGGSRN